MVKAGRPKDANLKIQFVYENMTKIFTEFLFFYQQGQLHPKGMLPPFLGPALESDVLDWNFISIFQFAEVSVGQHLYWTFGEFQVHAQVLITSWVVLSILIILSLAANTKVYKILPNILRNLFGILLKHK